MLAEHRFKVFLSFDGVEPAQRERGIGTHSTLVALLKCLSSDHRRLFSERLGLNMTVTPQTVNHLAEGVTFLLNTGAPEIHLSPGLAFQDLSEADRLQDLDGELSKVSDACLEHYEAIRQIPLVQFRNYRKRLTTQREEQLPVCGIARGEHLAIDVDGQAYGCARLVPSYQVFRGDLLTEASRVLSAGPIGVSSFDCSLSELKAAAPQLELFRKKSSKYSRYEKCDRCAYLGECQYCPADIGRFPENSDPCRVPDFLCAFNLVLQKHRRRFHEAIGA